MFKKSMIMIMVLMVTLAVFSVAVASEGPAGNDRKGKYTYRKVFKACAEAGTIESESPTISPSDKTMGEWKAIFENRTFNEFGCADQWAALSDEDILDIYSYFYNHASDSSSPATCK